MLHWAQSKWIGALPQLAPAPHHSTQPPPPPIPDPEAASHNARRSLQASRPQLALQTGSLGAFSVYLGKRKVGRKFSGTNALERRTRRL